MVNGKVNRVTGVKRSLGAFLGHGDMLALILAVYLGDVMSSFFKVLIQGGIMPLINDVVQGVAGKKGSGFTKGQIKIAGATIEAGKIVGSFLQLMLAVYVAYMFSTYFVHGYLGK